MPSLKQPNQDAQFQELKGLHGAVYEAQPLREDKVSSCQPNMYFN